MATTGIQGLLGPANGTTDTTSTSESTTANAFDMNSFLTMFLTQLKYQDPTNPMESYQLAAQLAQFSSVAKLTEASSTLKNIQSYSAAINNAEMASLVGKTVSGQKNTVEVKTDSVSTLGYQLDSATSDVTVTIKDSSGTVVGTLSRGDQAAGNYKIEWDGKDTSGTKVAAGTYTVEVEGVDTSGSTKTITTTTSGVASSLSLDDASPYYTLSDGTKLPASDIIGVETAATTSTAATETSSTTSSSSSTDSSSSTVSSTLSSLTSKLSSVLSVF